MQTPPSLVHLAWTIAPTRVQSLPGRPAVVQRRLVWASAWWNGIFLLVSSRSQVDLIVAKHKAILKFILNGRWNLLGLHTELLLQIRRFQDKFKTNQILLHSRYIMQSAWCRKTTNQEIFIRLLQIQDKGQKLYHEDKREMIT